jgi:CheY-like chemotaxis protein
LITVRDGGEARKLVQSQKFDGMVVADRLPHVDSFELIQQLKNSALNARVPIVMLTGDDNINTMRKGFKAGVTFFTVTPPSRERFFRLFNAVHGAMESERRRHHRLPYRTSVTCRLADSEVRNHFVAESVEISEGGMSVKTLGWNARRPGPGNWSFRFLDYCIRRIRDRKKPRKGLFAEHEPHVEGPQKVRATVRNLSHGGDVMGMDFQGLTAKQREAIQHYIEGNI